MSKTETQEPTEAPTRPKVPTTAERVNAFQRDAQQRREREAARVAERQEQLAAETAADAVRMAERAAAEEARRKAVLKTQTAEAKDAADRLPALQADLTAAQQALQTLVDRRSEVRQQLETTENPDHIISLRDEVEQLAMRTKAAQITAARAEVAYLEAQAPVVTPNIRAIRERYTSLAAQRERISQEMLACQQEGSRLSGEASDHNARVGRLKDSIAVMKAELRGMATKR